MDIGIPELLIILAIVIVLFGPARIESAGRALGEAIQGFRRALRDDGEAPPSGEKHRM